MQCYRLLLEINRIWSLFFLKRGACVSFLILDLSLPPERTTKGAKRPGWRTTCAAGGFNRRATSRLFGLGNCSNQVFAWSTTPRQWALSSSLPRAGCASYSLGILSGKRADMQCVRKPTKRSKSQELLHHEHSKEITRENLEFLGRTSFIPLHTWDAVWLHVVFFPPPFKSRLRFCNTAFCLVLFFISFLSCSAEVWMFVRKCARFSTQGNSSIFLSPWFAFFIP